MSFFQLVSLSIIQGLTEFLPVSSSGHLILFSHFTNFQDQGVSIDIALHLGSLMAVLIYFRKTIISIIKEIFAAKLMPDFERAHNKLGYLLIIASLPALVMGFCLRHYGMDFLRNPKIIGWTILFYGLLLYIADKYSQNERNMNEIGIKDALLIGFAQCLALIPGTSRSGITITTARFLKINRITAAKFSMLLSVPVIAAAGCLEAYRLFMAGNLNALLLSFDAVLYSFAASYTVIFFMMKWLQRWTYLPFVVYRVLIGILILLIL